MHVYQLMSMQAFNKDGSVGKLIEPLSKPYRTSTMYRELRVSNARDLGDLIQAVFNEIQDVNDFISFNCTVQSRGEFEVRTYVGYGEGSEQMIVATLLKVSR